MSDCGRKKKTTTTTSQLAGSADGGSLPGGGRPLPTGFIETPASVWKMSLPISSEF